MDPFWHQCEQAHRLRSRRSRELFASLPTLITITKAGGMGGLSASLRGFKIDGSCHTRLSQGICWLYLMDAQLRALTARWSGLKVQLQGFLVGTCFRVVELILAVWWDLEGTKKEKHFRHEHSPGPSSHWCRSWKLRRSVLTGEESFTCLHRRQATYFVLRQWTRWWCI